MNSRMIPRRSGRSWLPLLVLMVPVFLAVGCQTDRSSLAPTAALRDSESEGGLAVEGAVLSRATQITSPVVITEPGNYRVANDFSVPAEVGDGIVIRASGVRVSLDGHTITGPGNKEGRGIVLDGVTDVRVVRGTLANFGLGVAILGSSGSTVREITVLGGDEFADPPNGVPPQIGVMLINSFDNRITDSRFRLVNLGIFVRGGGSYENRIAHNRVVGGAHGLLAVCYNPASGEGDAGPHHDRVHGNFLSRFGAGIQTSTGSHDSIFSNNTIYYFNAAWNDFNGTNRFLRNETMQVQP